MRCLLSALCAIAVAALTAGDVLASRPIALGIAMPEQITAEVLPRLAETGATDIEIPVDWGTIAPATRPAGFDPANPDDPAYAWGPVDAQVQAAVGAGLTPLVVFSGAPSWASSHTGTAGQGPWLPHVGDVRDFARALAARFDGTHDALPRVRYWGVWNEPNITRFVQPQYENGAPVTPGWYRAVLNASAGAIHAAAPGNIVVAGNVDPFTNPVAPILSVPPMVFLRQLLCMSAGVRPKPTCHAKAEFDALAIHPYTSGSPLHKATSANDISLGNLPGVNALLQAARAAGHVVSTQGPELWVTEFGWDTSPPDPKAAPIALQTRWTAESVYWMWRNHVARAYWFALRDEPFPAQPYQSGLYFQNWRQKPTLRAFRFPFVSYLAKTGVSVWGRNPGTAAAAVRIQQRRPGGGWKTVKTFPVRGGGVFSTTVHVQATARDWFRATTLHDTSVPFSLTQPADRFYPPFGSS